MMKLVLQIFALLFIVSGVVTFPLPLPIGIILIAIGISMLIVSSRKLRLTIRKYRQRHPKVNEVMIKAEDQAPKPISNIIKKTNPDYPDISGS